MQLSVKKVSKIFRTDTQEIEVLRDVTFSLNNGQSLAIMGPSGAGKSTLLHLIGTLDKPTTGYIKISEQNPFDLSQKELAKFRNRTIGFVFQEHNLLPQYSVIENTLLPTFATGKPDSKKVKWAETILEKVGLAKRTEHRPSELSGGERQRVAIARSLINQPRLILCDEPTGNLDHHTANQITDLIFELHHQMNNILITVTHDTNLADKFQYRLIAKPGHTFAYE